MAASKARKRRSTPTGYNRPSKLTRAAVEVEEASRTNESLVLKSQNQ